MTSSATIASLHTVSRSQGGLIPSPSRVGLHTTNDQKFSVEVPASVKQVKFIEDLLASREQGKFAGHPMPSTITNVQATNAIRYLLDQPKVAKAAAPVREISEGGWTDGTTIFAVTPCKSHAGWNVKVWNADTQSLEYIGGASALPLNARKVTLEEAQRFGVATVHCCICSRKLTKDVSKAAGIGPICASRI